MSLQTFSSVTDDLCRCACDAGWFLLHERDHRERRSRHARPCNELTRLLGLETPGRVTGLSPVPVCRPCGALRDEPSSRPDPSTRPDRLVWCGLPSASVCPSAVDERWNLVCTSSPCGPLLVLACKIWQVAFEESVCRARSRESVDGPKVLPETTRLRRGPATRNSIGNPRAVCMRAEASMRVPSSPARTQGGA
jgi:hypothetical protein